MDNKKNEIVRKAEKKLRKISKEYKTLYFIIYYFSWIVGFLIIELVFVEYTIERFSPEYFEASLSITGLLIITLIYPINSFKYRKITYWRFQVLENIHHLQDFVEIRKIAEQKGVVRLDEAWLTEEYIKKNTNKMNQKSFLEKLEIFEYAFRKNFEEDLPKKIQYQITRYNILIIIFNILVPVSVISLSIWLFFEFLLDTFQRNFDLYFVIVLFILFFIYLIGFIVVGIRTMSAKRLQMEIDSKGIKMTKYKKKGVIIWTDIIQMEVSNKNKIWGLFDYLYIYTKEKQYEKTYRLDISNFKISPYLLLKQLNTLHQKYLETQK